MNHQPTPIALIITELAVGGAERALVNLAVGMRRESFAPVIYSLGPKPPQTRGALVEQLREASVETHFLNASGLLHLPRTARQLRALLRAQQPRLVQTFLYHANVMGCLAASPAAVPVVTGVRVAEPRRWRQLVERRWAHRRAQRVVCVSAAVAQYCRTSMQLPDEKLVIIPNGIDLQVIDKASPVDLTTLGVPAGRKVIVYVGRLDPQKGVDWLLDSAPRFLRALPEHDLLLVGDGPQQAQLVAQASASGLSQRVHFAGWQPQIASILRSSDVLVLPSRWEGLPNAVLEAMACARPVVASRVAGLEELLGAQAPQQTVTPGAADQLVERIVEIAGHPPLAAQLGCANRQRIAHHFPLSRMVERYLALYRELLHLP